MHKKGHVFFVGRGLDYALSMEAALKLKEVSYIFSEAYASGELKHGPIALLEDGRLVVTAITQPELLDKSLSNIKEIKARDAQVMAICREDSERPGRAGGGQTDYHSRRATISSPRCWRSSRCSCSPTVWQSPVAATWINPATLPRV